MQPSPLSTLKAPRTMGRCSEGILYRRARDTRRQLPTRPDAVIADQGVDMQFKQLFRNPLAVAVAEFADV